MIATVLAQLSPGHPAWAPARELQKLYGKRLDDIRDLIGRIPGASFATKSERIGITKSALYGYWKGQYKPGQDVMARIEAVTGTVNKVNDDAS